MNIYTLNKLQIRVLLLWLWTSPEAEYAHVITKSRNQYTFISIKKTVMAWGWISKFCPLNYFINIMRFCLSKELKPILQDDVIGCILDCTNNENWVP